MDILVTILVGIIGAVIGGFIMLFLEHRTPWFAHWRPSGNQYFDIDPEYRIEPTPKQMMKIQRALPSAQRNDVIQKHVGRKFKWHVLFDGARNDRADFFEVFFSPIGDQNTSISTLLILEQYPAFRDLQKKRKLWIAGEILRIEDTELLLAMDIQLAHYKIDQ